MMWNCFKFELLAPVNHFQYWLLPHYSSTPLFLRLFLLTLKKERSDQETQANGGEVTQG
jgi:hypothetical protein